MKDTVSEEILINGIDARTGLYLHAPATDAELARRTRGEPLSEKKRTGLLWLAEEYDVNDPERGLIQGTSARRLTWHAALRPKRGRESRRARPAEPSRSVVHVQL